MITDLDATDEHRQLDYLQAFAQRVKAYGTTADYAGYLIDTAHSHPSWETAAPYIRDDDEGAVALLNAPPESPGPDDAGQRVRSAGTPDGFDVTEFELKVKAQRLRPGALRPGDRRVL